MRKRKLKMVSGIFLLLLTAGMAGCGQKNTEKENLCHIVLEAGEGYHVTDPARTIKSGSDVSFTVTLDDNWQFLGTDYHGETEITKEDDGKTVNLVLHEVNYSESICIQAEKGKYEIVYDANGGQNISGDSDWQTAFNTFGALSIAAGLFGMPAAVALRIGANIFGAAYTILCNKVIDRLAAATSIKKEA